MRLFRRRSKKKRKEEKINNQPEMAQKDSSGTISPSIEDNIKKIKEAFHNSSDLIVHNFLFGEQSASIIYIAGLADEPEISENVLNPILLKNIQITSMKEALNIITAPNMKIIKTIDEIISQIADGDQILLVEKLTEALAVNFFALQNRAISEPVTERVVRGPKEAFTEPIEINLSLLRRRFRSPKLTIKKKKVGTNTQTDIGVIYIHGVANETLIQEVHARLERIDVDGIIGSAYIEEFIEDNPYSPFPQILNTERPDVVASFLLEGHVAILVDGSPFALIVPTTMISLLQASEDYYERYIPATLIRWLRYTFFVLALLLPSLYVCVVTFHQEMLPTDLIITIAVSREMVPFPALVEAIIMELLFEILREAGLRLPTQIGSAVSIVGALIVGESAVQAGIVSPPVVIVVALTGIASFALPRYNAAITIRILRFPIILLAGTIGLIGVMLSVLVIVIHLCSLRSFGSPYLDPVAPVIGKDLKDVLIRAPIWKMNSRPNLTGQPGSRRQDENLKPSVSKKE